MRLKQIIRTAIISIAIAMNLGSLWQIDLIRHIFIYECTNMEDALRIQFGFPLFITTLDMPLQYAFDCMCLLNVLSMVTLFLALVLPLRRKR